MYHTIGQRQGLGIGGLTDFPDQPWYVTGKDLDRNVLIAVQGKQHPLLFSRKLITNQVDWVDGQGPLQLPYQCTAKTRYRQDDQACRIEENPEGGYQVWFDQPQRAVTPGQSVVFYQGEHCLGGGIIETTFRDDQL